MSANDKPISKKDLEIKVAWQQEKITWLEHNCWANAVSAIIITGMHVGLIGYLIYQAAQVLPVIVASLAGKHTDASFNVAVSAAFSWSVAGVSALLWWKERKQKQKEVIRLTAELKDCQRIVDNGRQSSGLTADGRTHESDLP